MIKEEYNGHDIGYNEQTSKWFCDDLNLAAPQLSALKKLIDGSDEQQTKFSPPLLVGGFQWGKLQPQRLITSIRKNSDGRSLHVYVTEADGQRVKNVFGKQQFFSIKENAVALEAISSLRQKASDLRKMAEKIEKEIAERVTNLKYLDTVDELKAEYEKQQKLKCSMKEA